MKRIIYDYLKEHDYNLDDNKTFGISINLNDDEIVIKGSSSDLIELADYIVDVALSNNSSDHIHLDSLTLLNSNSLINNLIVEKE